LGLLKFWKERKKRKHEGTPWRGTARVQAANHNLKMSDEKGKQTMMSILRVRIVRKGGTEKKL